MTRVSKIAHLTALLLAAAPLPLMAQTAPTQPFGAAPAAAAPAPTAPAPAAPAALPPPAMPVAAAAQAPAATAVPSQVQAAAEQRIAGLQTQLGITQAQAPQWTAFAQVMRENAQATDAQFRTRAAGAQTMNAVANMQSYAQISRAYADGTEKLATAFQALYATLSDQQKIAADTLFRQQAAQAAVPVATKVK